MKEPRAPEGLQHLLPFHGPPETRAFVKVWSLDRRTSKIHSTSADVGSYIYILFKWVGEKMSSTYRKQGSQVQRGTHLLGTLRCLGKDVSGRRKGACQAWGREARVRQTTGMGKAPVLGMVPILTRR